MGASDYLYGGTGTEEYLQPDTGRATDLLVAGTMAAMFFTPIGGKVLGTAFRGIKKGATLGARGAVRAGKAAYSAVKGIDIKSTALSAKGMALKAYGGVTALGRGGARLAETTIRHGGKIAPAVLTGSLVAGAAAGIGDEAAGGPERYTRFEGGMPADNLGATGDLTLALHSRR